jgi:hypothetical protein
MSDKMDPVAAVPSGGADPPPPVEAAIGADRPGRPPTSGAKLATVDIVAGGKLAVTRPRMPWIFRLLFLVTGVRV